MEKLNVNLYTYNYENPGDYTWKDDTCAYYQDFQDEVCVNLDKVILVADDTGSKPKCELGWKPEPTLLNKGHACQKCSDAGNMDESCVCKKSGYVVNKDGICERAASNTTMICGNTDDPQRDIKIKDGDECKFCEYNEYYYKKAGGDVASCVQCPGGLVTDRAVNGHIWEALGSAECADLWSICSDKRPGDQLDKPDTVCMACVEDHENPTLESCPVPAIEKFCSGVSPIGWDEYLAAAADADGETCNKDICSEYTHSLHLVNPRNKARVWDGHWATALNTTPDSLNVIGTDPVESAGLKEMCQEVDGDDACPSENMVRINDELCGYPDSYSGDIPKCKGHAELTDDGWLAPGELDASTKAKIQEFCSNGPWTGRDGIVNITSTAKYEQLSCNGKGELQGLPPGGDEGLTRTIRAATNFTPITQEELCGPCPDPGEVTGVGQSCQPCPGGQGYAKEDEEKGLLYFNGARGFDLEKRVLSGVCSKCPNNTYANEGATGIAGTDGVCKKCGTDMYAGLGDPWCTSCPYRYPGCQAVGAGERCTSLGNGWLELEVGRPDVTLCGNSAAAAAVDAAATDAADARARANAHGRAAADQAHLEYLEKLGDDLLQACPPGHASHGYECSTVDAETDCTAGSLPVYIKGDHGLIDPRSAYKHRLCSSLPTCSEPGGGYNYELPDEAGVTRCSDVLDEWGTSAYCNAAYMGSSSPGVYYKCRYYNTKGSVFVPFGLDDDEGCTTTKLGGGTGYCGHPDLYI